MRLKKNKPEYALYVGTSDGVDGMYGAGTYNVNVLRIDREENRVTSDSYGTFEDFELAVQVDWQNNRFSTYSYRAQFKPYSVNFGNVETFAKVLKTVKRIESKFAITPASFGQYAALVAKGLGIKYFVTEYDSPISGLRDIKYVQQEVDRQIERVRERKLGAVAVQAS